MTSYPKYRSVDVGWADRLPIHWEMRRAKRIFTEKDRSADENDGVVTAFRDGEVTLRENRRTEGYTESLKKNNYQGIRKGDLVIHSMDAFAGAIGVSDSDGQSSPVYVVCRPDNDDEVHVHFYKYLLRHMAWSGYIESLAQGIRERSSDFRYSEFANQFLPVPPLQEQRAIAEELDEQISRIDEYIAKKRELIDLLEIQRRAVIDRAVTQGLDDGVEMMDSGVEWMGEIPAHWDKTPLKRVSHLIQSGPFGSQLKANEYVEGQVPVINPSNLTDGRLSADQSRTVLPEKADELKRHQVAKGDILFARRGKLGACALVTDSEKGWLCGTGCARVVPDKDSVYPQFALHYLSSEFIADWLEIESIGATMSNINSTMIGRIPMVLPSLDEQKKIVEHTIERTSEIEDAIGQANQQIDLMEQYRTSLVAEMVTGRVDVRNKVAA